jgi:hypothetical protein
MMFGHPSVFALAVRHASCVAMRSLVSIRLTAVGISAILGSLLLAPAANAAVIVDQGPTFNVVEYCEDNPAGAVTIRSDIVPGRTAGTIDVLNSIYSIQPAAGWTYSIKKAGGLNDAIEVQFTSGQQTALFKGRVAPGKTSIECPVVK